MPHPTETKTIAQEATFNITENAAKRIEELLADEEKGSFLRISVLGGGCSGFQYNYEFDKKKNDDDKSFKNNNIEVVIDETSLEFLNKCQLDFKTTIGSAAFEISNPNATANCGCGNSFAV